MILKGTVEAAGPPTVTIANTGTPAAGSITQGDTDVVVFGFALTPSAAVDFTAVNITPQGTAEATDISNFRLVHDANSNGLFDNGESVLATVAELANPLEFDSFSPAQTGIASARRYLLIADVAEGAEVGATFSAVIATSSDVTTTGTESGSASGNTMTIASASAPAITPSTFTLAGFGNVAAGSTSSEASFTVTGANLNGSVAVTAPTHFEVSTTTGTGFTDVVYLSQTDGELDGDPVTIHVRMAPTAAAGSVSGNIVLTSTGAAQQNIAVNGFAFASQPATAASELQFSSVGTTTMTIGWTRGSGDSVLVVMKAGSAVDADPADRTVYTANAAFGSGSQIGTGNRVVYKGVGTSVAVTGLSGSTTYHVELFEFNAGSAANTQNYQTTGAIGSQATSEPVDYISITSYGVAVTEDFNTLANTSTSSILPLGWFMAEQGTNANSTYTAGTGSATTGDTYSFGNASSTERALGGLASNNLQARFGAKIKNTTGADIQSLKIDYKGETWRFGAIDRNDSLRFSYSLNATSLTTGDWVRVTQLDYIQDGGATGAVISQNEQQLSHIITNIVVPNNSNVWIRWDDVNVSGNDDGMAIDDVSITANVFQATLTGTAGFRSLASPVANVALSTIFGSIWTQGFTGASTQNGGSNIFFKQGGGASAFTPATNITNTIPAGHGVLVGVFADDDYATPGIQGGFPKTLSVSGAVNAGDVAVTTAGWTSGWEYFLAGNPYSTTIDWDLVTKGGDVDPIVWVVKPDGNTDSWNGDAGDLADGLIAPFQGFLYAYDGPASGITFTNASKTSGGSFRGKESSPLAVRIGFSNGADLENGTWLQFAADGTFARDRKDAVKFAPFSSTIHQVYTLERETEASMDIHYLPILTEKAEFNLGFRTSKAGTFTLNASNWTLPEGWSVTIRDEILHIMWSLTPGTAIEFESGATDGSVPRFTLIVDPGTSTSVDRGPETVDRIALHGAYPNPFNPSTVIRFTLDAPRATRLAVYDMLGRQVAVLVDGQMPAGEHKASFDASNLTSGVYIVRLEAGGMSMTRRVTLLK